MTSTLRALVVALILAVTIAPAVLAESASSNVSESLTAPATISATVPASLAYTADTGAGAGYYRGSLAVTDVDTDNPAGLTVKLTASTLVSGGATVPLTDRQFEFIGPAGPWTRTATMYGTASITDRTIATSAAPVSGATLTLDAQVRNVTVPGAYTGTLTLTFTTN